MEKERRIQILDCTIRDGGYGLKECKHDFFFEGDKIKRIIMDLCKSDIDIIEVGLLEGMSLGDKKYGVFDCMQDISENIPYEVRKRHLFSAMIRNIDIIEEDIPPHSEELCDAIRIVIRYSNIPKSLDLCEKLVAKGYRLFIQPSITIRYSDEELKNLIRAANDMGAYALYIVDSYGFMDTGDIQRIFEQYDGLLNREIKIGFHGHNNMTLAFSNAQFFSHISKERKIIIDSCLQGLGQGGGNLQTELFMAYANRVFDGGYDFNYILEGCEEVAPYIVQGGWGYSVERFLAALYKTAFKYTDVMRDEYGLTYPEMNKILEKMPSKMRYRYTEENMKYILGENR